MLTLCDWQLILAAYAYEYMDTEIMSDASYDRMGADAAAQDTDIPGFLDYTGSWVGTIEDELYMPAGTLREVVTYALSLNRGYDDLHAPAIRASLTHHGIEFGCCCEGYNCWS